jgi:triacylglycerol lipase
MIKNKNFSEQSALFARLSNLVYKDPKEAKSILNKMGYTYVFYQNDGSQTYVIEDEKDIIVVCRGTEVKEWNDIKADLSISLVPSRYGIGKVHRGFRAYTDKIWEPVKDHIKKTKNKDLWITGHSLGAAMATLMARRCVLDISIQVPKALFTYGSPRVGNRLYIDEFNTHITHHRWVNDGDIVTKIPFAPFYYHSGIMHHISSNGNVTVNYDRKISWARILSLLLPHGIFKLLFGDVKDHSSELYVKQLSFWAMNNTGESQ